MRKLRPEDLVQLNRERFDALDKSDLIDLSERLKDLCVELYERLNKNSRNSSKPPSSDDPFAKGTDTRIDGSETDRSDEPSDRTNEDNRGDDADKSRASDGETGKRKPGKQAGAPGHGRTEDKDPDRVVDHWPARCAICDAQLEKPRWLQAHAGHRTYDLEQGEREIRIVCTLHRYHCIACECGHENKAFPGEGTTSIVEGRKRDLVLSENRVVGPVLATLIASLNREFKMSRRKIRRFLIEWFDFAVSEGTICNCIREAGVACYPVVERLIDELQEEEKVHLDETPWYQKGVFLWLWVAVGAKIVVYFVGSRKKEELRAVITEAFVGWLITDGYMAYRSHPNRQRCLAHLIRKAIGLSEAVDEKARKMGDWYLKELRGLIEAMADGEDRGKKRGPILARLKRACNIGTKSDHAKLKSLSGEILNDWDAVVAFVKNPGLPATNNEAERALRQPVIYRKICFGSRTDEGSRSFAALLSVAETCRRRGSNPWNYIANAIALARKGIMPPALPAA
jgi:hypothetical protein